LPTEVKQLSALGKHACPECSGDLEWNAAVQALKCPYCGTVVPSAPPLPGVAETAIVEHDLETALRTVQPSKRGWGVERREVQCQSCHAISVFADNQAADRCAFCGSPSIIDHQISTDAITPESVLPFKVAQTQCREALRKWYSTRWFAPNKLKRAALTDTLKGIYLPYWTFDASVSASWTAERGDHYYEGSGNNRVQKTRWRSVSGSLTHQFDDELVPGTVGVHAKLLSEIEPFPTTTDLQPYAPEFVRGWTVERYQVDLRKAATLNQQDMDAQVRAMCSAQVGGDTQRGLRVNAHYSQRTFKHVLVPTWLATYTYGAKAFQVIANGYSGKIAGERPYSWVKIFFYVILPAIILLLVMLSGEGSQ
jgi:hypothetical protein